VSPVQQVLPPQAMLYVENPGKYFTITLLNNTSMTQQLYLGISVEQVMPATGLSLSTPRQRQPQTPITLSAGQSRTLTMVEMKQLFNHIPRNEMHASPGLFEQYENNATGLLPEGQYSGQIIAYKWDLANQKPVALSSSSGGRCYFTVCYKAQAPEFLLPTPQNGGGLIDLSVAEVDVMNAQFTWRSPVVTCNPTAAQFNYEFKVVELLPNQQPDDAIERNPVKYRVSSLTTPMVIIPQNKLAYFEASKTYVAQVKAQQTGVGAQNLNWLMIENEGKSAFRLFKVKGLATIASNDNGGAVSGGGTSTTQPGGNSLTDSDEDEEDDGEYVENHEDANLFTDPEAIRDYDENSDAADYGESAGSKDDGSEKDSLYVFSRPRIVTPSWDEGMTRKSYLGENVYVVWRPIQKRGGDGQRPDTLKFHYDVELYKTTYDADYDEVVKKQKPIFKKKVDATDDDELDIEWDEELEKLELVHNDYLLLRVNPVCDNQKSIRYEKSTDNVLGFAISEHTTKNYFECTSTVEITNTTTTKKKPAEFKGKTVKIGEYELTIDQIEEVKGKDFFKGRGHVEWRPLGFKTMVAVKFDTLFINTDDQVYGGRVKSYPDDSQLEMSDAQVIDKLFSDWGIDNIFGDNSIPYASQIQSKVTEGAHSVAEKINLSKYYKWVKDGKSAVNQFLAGEVKDLHLPISIPKKYNSSPCDIQIGSMVFGPTYATMNIIGEFVLPDTKYTKNDILVFGAPRICISPENLLPESGTVALLGDFTVVDPHSTYECTFKCPSNALTPEDGTYFSWHANAFEQLGVDVEMAIPGTMKDVDGMAVEENAKLRLTGRISAWDDMIIRGSMEPFQVSGAPGYTFTAKNVVVDLSKTQNFQTMTLPKEYDRTKLNLAKSGEDVKWEGLYITEISAEMPKSFEFNTDKSKRLNVAIEEMYFDKSGATFRAAVNNVASAKTGKVGGWAFTMDKIFLNVLQDDFRDCGFSGTFSVPLLRAPDDSPAQIGYECRMLKITEGIGKGEMAYIFKTQQVTDLSLDCFLATAAFKQNQTYFLIEAAPDAGGQLDTKVELVMGGEMTINGTQWVNNKLEKAKLPIDIKLPGIHFCGMRIANCPSTWVSRFETEMQATARNAKLEGTELYAGTEFELVKDKLFFSTGRYSFASEEKWLGPFAFSLKKYEFKYFKKDGENLIKFGLTGTVKFLDDVDVFGGGAGFAILAKVNIPSSLSDLSSISMKYKQTDFETIIVDCSAAGMTLYGELNIVKNDPDKEGVDGELKIKIPGNFIGVKANGGFYRNLKDEKYNYGWFYGEVDSSIGIPIPPIVIKGGEMGFYFNCRRNGENKPEPRHGAVGFIGGLKLGVFDESMINIDARVTCAFDTKRKALSAIIFTGNIKAMDDLIDANANIVYNHDKEDRYVALDVTVDARLDAQKAVGNLLERFGADMEELKAELDAGYEKLKKLIPVGSLQDKIGDEGEPPSGDGKENGKDLSDINVEMGAYASIGFKANWMKNGKKLNPTKWYVCLGQPEEDKRCRITFIKFDVKLVSADVGLNAYFCVGNQLYENGMLPPIPTEISQFLNGKGADNGAGSVEGASLAQAEAGRKNAMADFDRMFATNGGGIMFGGSLWGKLAIDLGLLEFKAGLTAGMDLSVMKLGADTYCVNLKDKNGQVMKPGYHGWYFRGQIYAYLYAYLAVKLDLGFWSGRWEIADVGVGGMLMTQCPKPTYVKGEARVKVKLMNGWVNIDRHYSMEWGEGCVLFSGNALDEFKLFGELDIAKEDKGHGWDYVNRINPKLFSKPVLQTEAPLDEPFRVVDPTHLDILKMKYGDKETEVLEPEASATFVFRSNIGNTVTLYEYPDSLSAERRNSGTFMRLATAKDLEKYPEIKRTFNIKHQRYKHYIDLLELNPNCFYKLVVTGSAKEIVYGTEINPRKWNKEHHDYESVPWSKTKTFWFRTGPSNTVDDQPDLQDYVAIALPSNYNKLKDRENFQKVHAMDVKRPSIGLTTDLSKKAFKKGRLTWRLLDYGNGLNVVSESSNKWLTADNTCVMTPASELTGFTNGEKYELMLIYAIDEVWNGQKTTSEEILMDLLVIPQNHEWKETVLSYEKPFVGIRTDNVKFGGNSPTIYDEYYSDPTNTVKLGGKSKPAFLYDPYTFMSYLSNWAFVGGWEFSADRIDASILNTQSLIYTDKGGVYEGKLSLKNDASNVSNGAAKIRSLNIYDKPQWSKFTDYPLPVMTESEYNYVLPGLPRAVEFVPSYSGEKRSLKMASNYLKDWDAPWYVATMLNSTIKSNLKSMDDIDAAAIGKENPMTKRLNGIEYWYSQRHGGYATDIYKNVTVQIPYYQFPLAFGSCLTNAGVSKKITLWGSILGLETTTRKYPRARGHEEYSELVYASLLGKSDRHAKAGYIDHKGAKDLETQPFKYDAAWLKAYMPEASFSIYRCNAYDISNGCYTVNPDVYTTVYGNNEPAMQHCIESITVTEPLYKIEYQYKE